MENGTNPDYAQAFAAALGWWREAGVDSAFVDEPRSWLAPKTEPSQAEGPGRRKPRVPVRSESEETIPQAPMIPEDLEAFRAWWMTAPELDGGRLSGRVAPRGSPGPKLMILACMPESGDGEHLLAGAEGEALRAFARASGLADETLYWSSALPCHSPGADWTPEGNRLFADALVRHIALVRPERLLAVGFNILPLLGHTSPQGPAVSRILNHEGATVPMLAVRRLPAAPSQARWKSALWRAWLDWTA